MFLVLEESTVFEKVRQRRSSDDWTYLIEVLWTYRIDWYVNGCVVSMQIWMLAWGWLGFSIMLDNQPQVASIQIRMHHAPIHKSSWAGLGWVFADAGSCLWEPTVKIEVIEFCSDRHHFFSYNMQHIPNTSWKWQCVALNSGPEITVQDIQTDI